MEIDRIFSSSASRQITKTAMDTRGGSFQSQMVSRMAMQPLRDRFTLSSAVPEEGSEHPAAEGTDLAVKAKKPVIRPEDAVTIYTSDPTEVRLEKLRKMAEVSDYSGMSYEDIHTTIWNRYNTAFGGRLAAITSCAGAMSKAWCDINNQYVKETDKYISIPLTKSLEAQGLIVAGRYSEEANRIISDMASAPFGYSGMSYEEKEAAIFEKYKGRDSYLDFLSMQGELFKTGVYWNKLGGEGVHQLRSHMSYEAEQKYFPARLREAGIFVEPGSRIPDEYITSEAKFETLFNLRFDVRTFYQGMRDTLRTMIVESSSYDIKGVIEKCINESELMLEKHWRKQTS